MADLLDISLSFLELYLTRVRPIILEKYSDLFVFSFIIRFESLSVSCSTANFWRGFAGEARCVIGGRRFSESQCLSFRDLISTNFLLKRAC